MVAHRAIWWLQWAVGCQLKSNLGEKLSYECHPLVVGNIWLQLGHELSIKCMNHVLKQGGHKNTNNLLGP